MLTVSQVKADLPDCPVKIGKRRFMARLSGRLNDYATLTLSYVANGAPRHYLRGRPWIDAQYSWDAVTRAINENRPLSME